MVSALNPAVFRFARLLPTTSMAVALALKPERAVENDVDISSPVKLSTRRSRRSVGPGCGAWRQHGFDRVQVGSHIGGIRKIGEIGQLGDEAGSVRGTIRILILQLRHQQLE